MNKIIRLSKNNIKRHKKESFLLCILIALCMILLSSSVASIMGVDKITPKMVEESNCYRNFICVDQDVYSDKYLNLLDDKSKVESYTHTKAINGNSEIKNYQGSGKDTAYPISFVTESGERDFENYEIETSLSEEELKAIEHPIYLSKSHKDRLMVNEGDEITILFDKKEFSYTVAGFFDSGLWILDPKAVISDQDFSILEEQISRYEIIGFNEAEGADPEAFIKEFKEFVKDSSLNDTTSAISSSYYAETASNNNINMALLSEIIAVMAGVIVVAIMVMIRFRIVADITEQIVSIGVLEAIGYKSGEIALSYIFEYVLIALVGAALAIVPSGLMAGFLLNNAAATIYYSGQVDIPYSVIAVVMLGILLFVGIIAMTKALSVNKYPPVMAFRKGIATHHFKKTFFPLSKTKGNVHIRLALKDFFRNTKKNIGLTVCMTVTTIMVVVSFALGSFFSNGDKLLKSVSGHELPDINLEAIGVTDPEDFANELRSMPEVDRVLLSAGDISVNVEGYDYPERLEVYKDYSETKTIILTEGRLPKHENEIAVTSQAVAYHAKLGDTITLEFGKVKRDYLVCGVVNSVVDPNTIYMTDDAFRKMNPVYSPDTYKIFLKEDADIEAFAKVLTDRYGQDISETANGEVTGDTYEEKIKSAAEIKMAKAMRESGVSYMEYAIQVGDQLITGSTSNMKIKSLTYELEFYRDIVQQVSVVFAAITILLMVLSAIVVMIILSILMASTIRNKYRELGIMKGLGYTSRELKFQMAFMIIPPTIISVIIGTVISMLLIGLLAGVLAKITVSFISLVVVDIMIILFCFLCAYVNAKKIGKISVYELMTE